MRSLEMIAAGEGSLIVISDLHIGDGGPDERFHSDEALCRFLTYLKELVGDVPTNLRLLVLGDLLDLSLVGRASATAMSPVQLRNALLMERVDRVTSAHPAVFLAFKGLVDAGGTVDVVPGNTDAALRIARVWEHFRQNLEPGSSSTEASVQLHPWIYHLPGILYAEHGNQYHEINSYPALLEGARNDRPQQVETIGSVLDASGRRSGPPSVQSAKALAGWMSSLVAQYVVASQLRRTSSYKALLEQHARDVSLPPALVTELEGLGSRAAWRSGLRALKRRVAEKGKGIAVDGYLRDAALRVHRAARRHGSPARFYVFGHTHRAASEKMEGESSRYVNSGTWTTMPGWRERPTPYVHITLGREPSCRLLDWQRMAQVSSAG